MAVAVVIDESAAVAPGFSGACDARLFAYVGECSVAVVVIEDVFSVVGDVEIFPAVVVVIPDANALAPAGVSETGFLRNVGEGAVVIVVVQMAGGCLCGKRRVEACPVDDENIWPPIVVVIEDGDTRSRGFNDVFLRVHAAENYGGGKACFFRDVGEMGERFGSAFGELACAEENGKRQKQNKRDPEGFETEERTMSRTGNHELLAY
jgi:hypothetical protein